MAFARLLCQPDLLSSLCGAFCIQFARHENILATAAASSSRFSHLPRIKHRTLEADPARPRTIVVGDVHGCCDELKELLDACEYDERTTRVVLVGDLVNKGPLSVETVRFARASGFACVRGNHDASALDAWIRRRAGGDAASPNYAYMDGLTDDEVTFLRELPFTLRLVDTSTLIVHAGVVPGVPLEEQEPEAMCTMRNIVPRSMPSCSALASGADEWEWRSKASEGVAWAGRWRPDAINFPGVDHVIFGHDAKRGLQQHQHTTGLDTGACYGRKLTALVLPERRLVSVAARRMYSEPASAKKGGGEE